MKIFPNTEGHVHRVLRHMSLDTHTQGLQRSHLERSNHKATISTPDKKFPHQVHVRKEGKVFDLLSFTMALYRSLQV